MRTSCDFSVCISAQSHRFPFHSCTQGFLAALTHDPDATFQRDACTHLSLCMAQTGNSASSPKTRQFGVFLFPRWSLCLQRVIPADILIPHVVSLCETHTLVPTFAVYDLDVTSGLWWGGWTLVDACIVEWTSSWSSCNTDKEENPQPLHDFISDKKNQKN